MLKKNVTTAIVLDSRVQKKDSTYAIKLRVTFKRKSKLYPLNVFLTKDQWRKLEGPKPRGELKDLKIFLNEIELKAIQVINDLNYFSFESFKLKFNENHEDVSNVANAFNHHIDNVAERSINTAESYRCAKVSILKYAESKKIEILGFSDITPDWLKGYEKWMLDQGKSISTVGIYLRSLRTIFNNAIAEGVVKREIYPFEKRKYVIPNSKNTKIALDHSDIEKLWKYKPINADEAKALDLWFFSYLCSGINVKDIVELQYKNIGKETISFIRAKTRNSSRSSIKPVIVPLLPEAREIIERMGVKNDAPETFVFGLASDDDSTKLRRDKIKQVNKTINLHTKRIAEKLGIAVKLTTYVARHSYATRMLRQGAPMELISESLGHSNIKTTESYLNGFENSTKMKYQSSLLDFRNS
ncbi:MAG: site-specific integrase [Cytophagales bacterium]|nr:site-specific integrase [Cytophagales bacterium]